MFLSVCPHCGLYQTEKAVRFLGRRGIVRCAACGGEHEYLALPLFIALGASGTGKSTLALHLQGKTADFLPLDGDLLWRQEFASQGNGAFFSMWMQTALNISQGGKPVLLFLGGMPEDFLQNPMAAFFPAVHVLGLYADEEDLVARLRARPAWRNSAQASFLASMRTYNAAVSRLQPSINTSRAPLEDCARALCDFVLFRT